MSVKKLKIAFYGVWLILFPLSAWGKGGNLAGAKIDQIIYANQVLHEADQEFNAIYNQALSQALAADKIIFKNSIGQLAKIKARCLNADLVKASGKKNSKIIIDDQEYFLSRLDYQKGCIKTWYKTIGEAIKMADQYPQSFKIPQTQEYINFFKQRTEAPYEFNLNIANKAACQSDKNGPCGIDDNQYRSLEYIFYFPISKPQFFLKTHNQYSFKSGSAHGQSQTTQQFGFTRPGNNRRFAEIQTGSYLCAIPLVPWVIGGEIYLPENIDFTKSFNNLFGQYSSDRCYACSGQYRPNCLSKLSNINKVKSDTYLVFSEDYLNFSQETQMLSKAKSLKFNDPCLVKIIQKYAQNYYQLNDQDPAKKLFLIKESDIEEIKADIQNKCWQ